MKMKLISTFFSSAIFCLGILFSFPNSSSAQIVFTTKTTADGLVTDNVNGVAAAGNNIYVTSSSGLSVSNDGGNTFVAKTTADGLGSNNTLDVFVDGTTVYVATANGLSISMDGGNTFTNYQTGLFPSSNFFLDVFVDGSTIYVGGSFGLFISNDGGATFIQKSEADGLGNRFVRGVVASGSTVYAATDGGLSISVDGGNTFFNKTLADGLANDGADGISLSGNIVYTASEGFAPVGGLSITADLGNTFVVKQQAEGLAANSVNCVFSVGPNVYVGTSSSSISVSNDAANTFSIYNFPTIPGIVGDVFVDGDVLYVATSGGLLFGTDPNFSVPAPPPPPGTAVPTMGQWGLIIFALLMLTFGILMVRQKQLALTNGNMQNNFSFRQMPFDRTSYNRWLLIVGIGMLAVFAISIALFGYEMTNADVPGSLLAIPVAAYLLHLVFGLEE